MKKTILSVILFAAFIFLTRLVSIAADRPNILLIITDQQCADAMSHRMERDDLSTPHMDSLAKNGVLFSRAYTPNPLCMPARASLFTGRFPHETGVNTNIKRPWTYKDYKCMGTYFREAGYDTAYFGKWHLLYDVKDVATHGFETVRKTKADKEVPYDTEIADASLEYLSRSHEKPFLAVVSFLNPHNICQVPRGEDFSCGPIGTPPPPEKCPPPPANIDVPENETDTMVFVRTAYQNHRLFPVGGYQENDWRKYRWSYYRMIEKVDHEIGRVLGKLRDNGLDKNTVVVFTSDHGECAGAHRFNQKTVFYEESVRVPLIISSPTRNRSGIVQTDKLVNIGVDILPTILSYAGLTIPENLPGKSLKILAEGKNKEKWRHYLVLQNHMDQSVAVEGVRPSIRGRLVVTDRFKYAVYSEGMRRDSLFDLENDPGEMKNLVKEPDFEKEVKRHRRLLTKFDGQYDDPLSSRLIENDVPGIPFVNAEESFSK